MTFLSHGPENSETLENHSLYVAKKSQELVSKTKFNSHKVAYYAGLLHDLGKVNPYYQELFRGGKKEELKKYDSFHAPYSCWFAKSLLKNTELDKEDQRRVVMMIDAHHSFMKNNPGNFLPDGSKSTDLINRTLQEFLKFKDSLSEIKNLHSEIPNIKRLKFNKCLNRKSGECGPDAFLECGFLFSAMLQSDRGSFSKFQEKIIGNDFTIDTTRLVNSKAVLADFRSSFQSSVQQNINHSNPITVLCAPTGSGKTKAFLDLIPRYHISRVFYFSPLLALTDDISQKLQSICGNSSQDILVYNHTFTNTLDKKSISFDADSIPKDWRFDFEAFNEKMIITTTKRLLMTIYSNSHKDKIKLASFRNSLLIIDEVQTLPKFLLKNLVDILNSMSKYLDTKTLLVSATIPYELSHLPTIKMPDDFIRQYLAERNRKIVKSELDLQNIIKNKTLIMANTRKNTKKIFKTLKHKNKLYVSSGIKKEDRVNRLESIKKTGGCTLVSTQVVESGVDISFDTIWRQMAPLDNIIQVMGRLDRESKDRESALYIFDVDISDHTPYSSLEFSESKKIIKGISDSSELYKKLPNYYELISTGDNIQKKLESDLLDSMEKLDFVGIWKMVEEYLGDSFYESVFIPNTVAYDDVRADLLSQNRYKIKRHIGIEALLPISSNGMRDYFDDELYENNILLPKKEKLGELYDKELGLDKWIK